MEMKTIYASLTLSLLVLLSIIMFARASDMDDQIESSAKESYVFKSFLMNDDIKVKSDDGVVTLTGTVSEEFHKSLAHDSVANLPGVKRVENNLEVKGTRPAENSDAWITAKVKTALLFHKNVSSMTEVTTTDGVVTLRGEADNQAQKDLTTEYAKDIDGVKDVKNEMTVKRSKKRSEKTVGENIDDASITAQVKASLFFHRSTSAVNTKVETNNGVVTLTGKAKNAAEKDLVTKLVKDVKGVRSVENELTIEPQ